ncbi:MAG: biotin--[acetyl-CoA-carboxylase] ligase [Spirochaetota bacterium]
MAMKIWQFDLLDSTMSKARELCSQPGAPELFGVLAESQSAGRGRVPGRTWETAPGKALLLTLALRDRASGIPALPLKAGLAACDCLEGYGARLAVKWPNDLLAQAGIPVRAWRKISGILCEATGGWVLVGIGVNLAKGSYPHALEETSTSLEESCLNTVFETDFAGPEFRLALARRFGEAFLGRLHDEDWRNAYLSRMWGLGEAVEFLEGHPHGERLRSGVLEGVDAEGSLLIRESGGLPQAYNSGEIRGLRVPGVGGRCLP